MKAIFLKPYGPFKVGQAVELPPLTFEKLSIAGIIKKFAELEKQILTPELIEQKKIKKRKDRMIKKPLVEK